MLKRIVQDFRQETSPPVFLGAAGVIIAFVIYGAGFSGHASVVFENLQQFITDKFGWFYILTASIFLIFVIFLAFSKYGNIRLGGEQTNPEFGSITWFTMLMAAGVGIGLVFFGVAEPIGHFVSPPEAGAQTSQAIREAMLYSFFHWGLHPWAIYLAIALPLAYFHFRHRLPMAPRSLLYPLIGDRIYGWIGHLVDILATVGTLFGVGTSLGLGAMQINAGLGAIFGVSLNLTIQLIIIAIITTIATISVVTGLHMGIKRLSQFNMGLAGILLLFVIITGPTIYIFETFITSVGYYIQNLAYTSFRIDQAHLGDWQANWTIFYWSWWIAWSPFVGVFAARISRGRTIRELILAMLLVPSIVGFFWFSAMGGASFFIELFGQGGIIEPTLKDEVLSFYALLDKLPVSFITSILGTLLIVVFFITSSDSGSLVDVMVTSGGNPNPPFPYRIFWCVTEGLVAATLLITGGLTALRVASLIPALPFALFLLVACYGLLKALRVDIKIDGLPEREELKN